ncbi:GMC family oxidoreductase [Streptomyces sp. SID13031]|uniref:GMC oxidoreductase n=1 Tax=Streptomyces sp. SID13031 TaxID=2706046 RepID=UPI0013C7F9D6|nr:GMC family oxidoreductase [Streptomyces sp. SID13031]NEA34155.1 GMC family oxidoreductase [Streptomyces sp. SID13031]
MIFDHDVIVIGSGFGGSVSALRLVEKGYDVGVLEAGPRYEDQGFAKNSWDTKRFLFAPKFGMYGIQRISALRDVIILSGAGVGGGSLVYANTLYEPLPAFYADKQWAHITDWKSELAPYYDQAKRMLGVTTYPGFTPADKVMKQVADDMGVGDTFHPTPVGVFFGEPGVEVDDPYFGGAGPRRSGCIDCGECMTGCRHNAKNTLTKNYLYLAEKAGAEVYPMTTVTSVEELPGGGYAIETRRTSNKKATRKFTAQQVIFAASALGTAKLLHRLRDEGKLPHLSDRLGVLTRTNSESLLGAIARDRDVDYTKGVAITSSFHPDDITHIEPVRYGRGSNVMSLLQTVLTDGGGDKPRWRTWLRELAVQRKNLRRLYDLKHWSERTVIALVMQTADNSITTYGKRDRFGRWRLTSKQGHGAPNPSWIPVANEVVRRMAKLMGGTPGGTIGEPFNVPMTAHFIGGCAIGDSAATGVVDPYHRVYGYDGLHIVDGSTISANLGVNPSLTITAQAERALSFWPNKGDEDARPAVGAEYQRVAPVTPVNPVVPVDAPAALRLPIVTITKQDGPDTTSRL